MAFPGMTRFAGYSRCWSPSKWRRVLPTGSVIREDASAIRLRNAAANFALLRRFALNLFVLDKRSNKSPPKKRRAAAWNSRHVVDLLNLRLLQEI